jgi:predicted aspartyl protease
MLMLLVSLAVSACAGVPDGRKPLAFSGRAHQVVVPVLVDGQGPFRFLLDTGASRSLISTDVARKVGAATVSRTRMVTAAGHSVRPVTLVQLQVGDVTTLRVAATILATAELRAGGRSVDGILGQDVLARHAYTIDYRRRQIRWDEETCFPGGVRLPLDIDDGRAVVTLPAPTAAGAGLRMIPDSGADGLVLFARRGRLLPDVTGREVAMMRTLAGRQLVRRVLVDRLRLGNFDLVNQPAVVLEADATLSGDGLLPLHGSSRVHVNGPAGYLVLER